MGIGIVRGQNVYRQRWLNAYRDSQGLSEVAELLQG